MSPEEVYNDISDALRGAKENTNPANDLFGHLISLLKVDVGLLPTIAQLASKAPDTRNGLPTGRPSPEVRLGCGEPS